MRTIPEIQAELRARGIEAWLFCDHHHRDPIAYRILGLPEELMVSRRWYYLVPAEGDPVKLVHRIEAFHLDELPGRKLVYAAWQQLVSNLEKMFAPYKRIAMQFSPNNRIFYVSLVDGGTVDLVRSLGKEVISSANLVATCEATWSEDQIASHFAARDAIDSVMSAALHEIGRRARSGGTTEFEIQQWIEEAFNRENLVANGPQIVAVNENSSNPHYAPTAEVSARIEEGDFVLLDLWAKKNEPNAVYYDISWTGYVGGSVPEYVQNIFDIVRRSRDAAINKVQQAIGSGQNLAGWEVDKAARDIIEQAGYGAYFNNRTGHSIGTEVHGNGANMDNFEVRDEREVIPNTCFSIEPGIYLPDFGLRSEVNMLVRKGSAEVTGKIQQEVVLI
ncbi:MAG TPA: Xaa-Pro peptidase family protein [Terriglobales bacterium]|nr:Xaa-Pro peptidase family protein [Terriglobales bacterium]